MESYTDSQQSENVRNTLINIIKRWNKEAVKEDCKYDIKTSSECIAWLEKQGGPKFKVGDWVVNSVGKTNQIVSADSDGCGYTLDDDTYFSGSWCDNYHLWSIDDAEDGDILYSLDSGKPFIYKSRKQHEQAEVYCGININGKFFVGWTNDSIITTDKYIPATKEQRYTLFKAMHEAGYMWDSESKELMSVVGIKSPTVTKGESKFKVGDWIVDEIDLAWMVTEVTDTLYVIHATDAYELTPKKELVEKGCRLWSLTIDAKPGDVLVADENRRPFIFKGMLDESHPNSPVAYCGLDTRGNFIVSQDDAWWPGEIITPSTPSERDLLFERMTEAGYVWNEAEKTLMNVSKLTSFVDEDKSNLQCVINVWNRFRRGEEAGITPNQMEKLEEWLVSLQKSIIL
jgi:hypothetical protein